MEKPIIRECLLLGKRFVLSLLVFLYMTLNCYPVLCEGTNKDSLLDAAYVISLANQEVVELMDSIQDEDSKTVLQGINASLSVAAGVFMDGLNPENSIDSLSSWDGTTQEYIYFSDETGTIVSSGIRHIPEVERFYEAQAGYDEGLLIVHMTMYHNDGQFIAEQRVEIGKKEEEYIFLLIDYDEKIDATGRFATRIENGKGSAIFTKTYGKHMDIRLNVESWIGGMAIEQWTKDMLLPLSL